jgi:mono/diheme cytochrome c family protein
MSRAPAAILLSAALLAQSSMASRTRGVVGNDEAAIARGQLLFAQYCASCHGDHGKGNGPTAASLTVKPGDLTQMENKYGAFLGPHLESAIRGTNPALVHRAPNMIVWGAILRAQGTGGRAAADARVRDLIAYLESIQEH